MEIRFEMFFDRAGVQAKVKKKERRVLSGTGAFTRTVMRRGMRPGGKKNAVSRPGEYPRTHGKAELKNLIVFGYDEASQSVVTGPMLFANARRGRARNVKRDIGGKTLPEFVNEGGVQTVTRRTPRGRVTSTIRYEPRPFRDLTMPLALAKFTQLMEREQL
jgi:hypothetical protein